MILLISLLIFILLCDTIFTTMIFRKLRDVEMERARAIELMDAYKDNFFKMVAENTKQSRAIETLIKC